MKKYLIILFKKFEVLDDNIYANRKSVIESLSQMQKDGINVIEDLLQVAIDGKREYIYSALIMIKGITDNESVEILRKMIPGEDINRQIAIAYVLAILKCQDSFEYLIRGLHAEKAITRELAVRGLAELRDSRVIPHLLNVIDDQESSVRRAVAISYEFFYDQSVYPYLEQFLFHDPAPDVRGAAQPPSVQSMGTVRLDVSLTHLMMRMLRSDVVQLTG